MPDRAHTDRIEEEASLWAARLRGRGMTDADRAALAAWLEADPERRWVLGRYRELSTQLDAQLGLAEESLEVMRAATRRSHRTVTAVVLAAAAAVAVATVIWSRLPRDFAT